MQAAKQQVRQHLLASKMNRKKFHDRVKIDDASGCWLWTGMIQNNGYGTFRVGGRAGEYVRAHRLSWMLFRGRIPEGMLVCHACDVKTCVNPDHLFIGTARDNALDMYRKGRQRSDDYCLRGEVPWGKLKARNVRAILRSKLRNCDLARKYRVSPGVIWRIRNGKIWRSVTIEHGQVESTTDTTPGRRRAS